MEEVNNTEVKSTAQPNLRFNFGAFAMSIWFAIGTGAWLCLLALIPGINLIMMFVAGFKGAEWAWQNGRYTDVDEFNAVMESWHRAGKWCFIAQCVITGILLVIAIIFVIVFVGFFAYAIAG